MPNRLVRTQCPNCKAVTTIECPEPGFTQWLNGDAVIQQALPTLTPDQREALITGICPKCWEAVFGEDEDEDTTISDDVIISDSGGRNDGADHIDGYDSDNLGESPDY